GEDDLAGHAVAVELAVAPGRVPPAPQPLLVLPRPLLGELLVAQTGLGQLGLDRRPLDEELVERAAVPRVEPVAVLGGRETGVAVRRDDRVLHPATSRR